MSALSLGESSRGELAKPFESENGDHTTNCVGMCSRRFGALKQLLAAIEAKWPELRGMVKCPTHLMMYEDKYPRLKSICVAQVNSAEDHLGFFFRSILEFTTCIVKSPLDWNNGKGCWLPQEMYFGVWRAGNHADWPEMLRFFGPPGKETAGRGDWRVKPEDNEGMVVRKYLRPEIERRCGVDHLGPMIRAHLWACCSILARKLWHQPARDDNLYELGHYGHTGDLLNSKNHPVLRRLLITVSEEMRSLRGDIEKSLAVHFVGTVEQLVYDHIAKGKPISSPYKRDAPSIVLRSWDVSSSGFSEWRVVCALGRQRDRSMEGLINSQAHTVRRQVAEPLPDFVRPFGVFDQRRFAGPGHCLEDLFDRQRAKAAEAQEARVVEAEVGKCSDSIETLQLDDNPNDCQ